jgi:hypothetical protein
MELANTHRALKQFRKSTWNVTTHTSEDAKPNAC